MRVHVCVCMDVGTCLQPRARAHVRMLRAFALCVYACECPQCLCVHCLGLFGGKVNMPHEPSSSCLQSLIVSPPFPSPFDQVFSSGRMSQKRATRDLRQKLPTQSKIGYAPLRTCNILPTLRFAFSYR